MHPLRFDYPQQMMPLKPIQKSKRSASRQGRILLVDDEVGFTRLLKINLELTGLYVVHAENDPRQAHPAALEFEPDLVLLDMMMPELNGSDVVELFNADPVLKQIPIIMLTATMRREDGDEEADSADGVRYLTKPLNMTSLLECLDDYFED
jgi:CheY-like chemotaxis protein